jgi:alpha-galactosidase
LAHKIVLIGAGSHFTTGVVRDLMNSDALAGSTFALMDLNPDGLDVASRLVKRMVRERKASLEVEATTDLGTALDSADYVITTILVGGLEVCKPDIDIPMKYGVYQSVGDSVGPGGLIRAFRTVPAMVKIAKEMERACPDAWLFNYSNPLTCLSIGVREATDIKMLGLCHGVQGTLGAISGYMDADPGEIDYVTTGINHLTWLLDLRIGGRDAYPRLREMLDSSDIQNWPISSKLCRIFGYFPSPGDRHIAEFFPYYLTEDAERGARYGLRLRDIEGMQRSKEERTKTLLGQAETGRRNSSSTCRTTATSPTCPTGPS